MLNEPAKPVHSYNPLVQINRTRIKLERDARVTGPRHADRPSHVARFTSASTSEDSLVSPTLWSSSGNNSESVQGWVPTLAYGEKLRIALEKASTTAAM